MDKWTKYPLAKGLDTIELPDNTDSHNMRGVDDVNDVTMTTKSGSYEDFVARSRYLRQG